MTDINLEDLTNLNSEGIFDKLMSVMQERLKTEHQDGRITGTEYSKVFLGLMEGVLSQSMQFLLQKDQAAKQVEVLEAQRLLATAQTEAVTAEIALTEKQTLKVIKETEILDIQKDLTEAQVLLTTAQTSKTDVEVEILEIEKTKTAAEVNLVNASTAKSNKEVEVLNAQLANIPKEGDLIDKQVTKANAETVFLTQRIKTETAQIVDTIDGVPVAGVIGKQKYLYQAQTDGFKSDSKIKLLNALTNTWVVRRSTDEGTVADNTNRLSDSNIGVAVAACMIDSGMTPP